MKAEAKAPEDPHSDTRLDQAVRTFITDEMSAALSSYARSKHEKRPAIIREAIAEYLVRRGYLAPPQPPHQPPKDEARE